MRQKAVLPELSAQLESLEAAEGLRLISEYFPGEVVFSTSLGQEDQVITEMIATGQLDISIFTLETGRLFAQTKDLLAETERRYNIRIRKYYPDNGTVEKMVSEIGLNGFYESVENRRYCCHVRKVLPLQVALSEAAVWITGLRAGQSANRGTISQLEWDEANKVIKYNPIIDWSYEQMLSYIKERQIPYNPLHDVGFVSIGCEPCTRAIMPDEEPRAGRWWWESSHKECGLHIKKQEA
jgi:phosphoadenosine phosphosulfate reductase